MSDNPTLGMPAAAGEPPEPFEPEPFEPEPFEPEPSPPGRHRRGLRIALIAGAAALVLVTPVALIFALRGGSGETPPPVTRPTAAATSRPAASPAPTSAPASATGAPAPDGRIAIKELKNATLDIPPWPADNLTGPSGRLKFVDGVAAVPHAPLDAVQIIIFRVAYGDVDRDGAQETVAEIGCMLQSGSLQLVAFDRDAAGRIVTLGTVVATTGELRAFGSDPFTVRPDGVVDVQVGDYQRCCGDQTPPQWQRRGYAWNGHGFDQVSGPVRFPLNPRVTELGATVGELVLGPATDGARHGTLTVTLTYLRGAKPDHLSLRFYHPADLERDGSAWPPVHILADTAFTVDLPALPLGGVHTYTFAFKRPATATGGDFSVAVRGVDAGGADLGDANPYNNGGPVTIRTAD